MTKSRDIFYFFSARGFGMRVVGGKIGPDGQMFASIVWTVPGGPAEKAGLQQGDKVKSAISRPLPITHKNRFTGPRMVWRVIGQS